MQFDFLGPSGGWWWQVFGPEQLPLHFHGRLIFTNGTWECWKTLFIWSENLTCCTLNYLLQRWKEQYFVNVGTDCGLTIAGFYYICFSCSDGSISGFYYDPNSRCSSLLFPIGLLCSQFFNLNLNNLVSLIYLPIISISIFYHLSFFYCIFR